MRDTFPETRHQRDWVHKTKTYSTRCQRASTLRRGLRFMKSRRRRTRRRRSRRWRSSPLSLARNGPKSSKRSPPRRKCCSPSTISQPNTGCIFGRPIPSKTAIHSTLIVLRHAPPLRSPSGLVLCASISGEHSSCPAYGAARATALSPPGWPTLSIFPARSCGTLSSRAGITTVWWTLFFTLGRPHLLNDGSLVVIRTHVSD